jgi:hypothetical protein
MKTHFIPFMTLMLMLISYGSAVAQFDDLYFDARKDALPAFAQPAAVVYQNYSNDAEYYDEYDVAYREDVFDDYDYSYTNRIRRFHAPARVINHYSFNSWYDDFYYDPFFPENNVNVFVGSPFIRPWGWNSWNVGWGWNSWGPGWGWNSWNTGWGWNSWNQPWGWNSWNNGLGWNSWNNGLGWNSCPTFWTVNNNYYGNGWNNWNNNGGNNNAIYGSRRAGSVSSSTRGRDASPRREIIGGGISDQGGRTPDAGAANINNAAARSGADRSRIYRGDISAPNNTITRDNSGQTSSPRSSIYKSPQSPRSDSGVNRDSNAGSSRNNSNPGVNQGSSGRSEQNKSIKSSRGNSSGQGTSTQRPAPDQSRSSNMNQGSNSRPSGGFDSGSSGRSSSGGSINSGSSRSSSGGSMNSGGGSSGRSSSGGGGGSRRGGG